MSALPEDLKLKIEQALNPMENWEVVENLLEEDGRGFTLAVENDHYTVVSPEGRTLGLINGDEIQLL